MASWPSLTSQKFEQELFSISQWIFQSSEFKAKSILMQTFEAKQAMSNPVLLPTNLNSLTLACGKHNNIWKLLESLPGAPLVSRKLQFHDLLSMLTRVKCGKGLLFWVLYPQPLTSLRTGSQVEGDEKENRQPKRAERGLGEKKGGFSDHARLFFARRFSFHPTPLGSRFAG